MGLSVLVLCGKKEEANPEIAFGVKLVAKFFHFTSKEFGGDLREDTRSVARFGVSIEGTPMGELANAVQSAFENGAGAPTLNICDDPDATGIMFLRRMIEPLSGGHCVVEREPRHGMDIILQRKFGARVGILLREKAFGGMVEYGS